MRILILTQYYPPEVGAAQNRLSGLANFLKEAGNTVTVLTAMPNYPKGKIYDGYQNRLFVTENKGGIAIIRTWLYTKQNLQFLGRLFNYFSFTALALFVSLYKFGRQDIVITECPPLFVGIAGWMISKMKKAKFVLNVSDLWTDSAVDLGMLKNGRLISIALRAEKFLYQHSHLVTGQTLGIVNAIRSRTAHTPVALITNGVDPEFFQKTQYSHLKRQEVDTVPSKKFVVGFAGLHGLMQDLETVIEAACLLRQEEGITFILYGDGPKKEKLIRLSTQAKIQNVIFSSSKPAERMPEIFSSFDAMLIPLKDLPILRGAIPCKMLEAMAAAVPILLLAKGEAKNLVLKSRMRHCRGAGKSKDVSGSRARTLP